MHGTKGVPLAVVICDRSIVLCYNKLNFNLISYNYIMCIYIVASHSGGQGLGSPLWYLLTLSVQNVSSHFQCVVNVY